MNCALLFPTRFEAGGILKKLVQCRRLPDKFPLWQGRLERQGVVVAIVGIGPEPARRGTVRFMQAIAHHQLPVERAMLAGFAGALDPALRRSTLCWDTDGGLHTADRVVATPREKSALRAETGARLVDMEFAAIASLFADAGIPLRWVRVISDAADVELPSAALARGVDPRSGQPTPLRLCAHLLCHPLEVPPLLEFICGLPEIRDVLTRELLRHFLTS